ncbi:MAG: hypothetical protein A2046_09525 [Bacteroidetes bacterium GWA2_30_7]|nr:MAG: hypothetical protein A2046_09525 [Bacteroidetes bacterium GWA2_30_7]
MNKITTIRGFLDFIYSKDYAPVESQISLIYEGEITHQIMKAFTSMTETSLGKNEESSSVSKKVFSVMVECLQNIGKHADAENVIEPEIKRGIFLICKSEDNYNVITGNFIDHSKLEGLKHLLENINTLNKEGLKELYKNKIKVATISEKGGAGLGFIDIARKTGEKLIYDFIPVTENTSFFILKSTVSRNSLN